MPSSQTVPQLLLLQTSIRPSVELREFPFSLISPFVQAGINNNTILQERELHHSNSPLLDRGRTTVLWQQENCFKEDRYSINFLFQSHKALNNAEIIVAIKQVHYSS